MRDKQRIYYYGVQQDERWHRLRNGLFTSSDIYIIFQEAKTKKQKESFFFSKTAVDFIKQKAGDLLHDKPIMAGGSSATEWGNDYEGTASKEFEKKHELFQDRGLNKLSFVEILNEGTGTSPDDTIKKLIPSEYKCPYNRNNHLKHLEITTQEELLMFSKQKYYQILHQMFVLGSDIGYWSSFDPRLKGTKAEHNALHTIEIKEDSKVYDLFCQNIPKAVELRDYYFNKWISNGNN